MMVTKKELEQEFGITRNTVGETLKACLLDTAQREYSDEEKARFSKARQLVSEGKSYDDVRAYFLEQQGEEQPPESSDTGLYSVIRGEVEASTRELVKHVVVEVLQLLPQMTVEAFQESLNSGHVEDIYRHHRQEFVKEISARSSPLLEAPLPDSDEGKKRSQQLER